MKKRGLIGCVLLAFALLFAARTLYVVYAEPARAFDSPTPVPTKKPLTVAAATPEPTLSPEEQLLAEADADFMRDRVNILLLGYDQSPERDDETETVYRSDKNGYRSDVMILLTVHFAENSAHLISIPRDTYSPIYMTRGRWKINAAFAKGGGAEGDGFLYARKTVEMLFSVPVDYYAGVSMEGLKKLVDALGGVDYDVDVPIQLNGRTLEPGFQHLSGQQVLDYCRARKGISTDVGRNDRQQRMLMAIFRQLQSENRLTSIPALYQAVRDDVHTNLTASQIAALSAFALRLPLENLRRSTLAGEYVSNVYNASYYVLENKKLIQLVRDEFGITIKRESKYDLAKVKRDKAAAEAAKAAESTPDVAAMLTLPADTSGTYERHLADNALAAAERLETLLALDAELPEIRRAQNALMRAVKDLMTEFDLSEGLPEAFDTLRSAG